MTDLKVRVLTWLMFHLPRWVREPLSRWHFRRSVDRLCERKPATEVLADVMALEKWLDEE